jgi:low affinity Fe/Cu permease
LVVAGASSTLAAVLAAVLVVGWVLIGVGTGFDHRWFDVLSAITCAVTFVMVFLIQHTTGVENRAVLLKLDELIRATEGARNDVIAAEHRTLEEQNRLEDRVTELSRGRG